jgi:Na+-transporting NADH:ubiquinone oxidoreductase subunit NqrF
MIKYATDRQLPLKITLFDSNRNQDNILYKEEFDEWANSNKNLKIIYTLTGDGGGGESGQRTQTVPSSASSSSNPLAASSGNDWKGEIGFINKQMFSKYISTDELDDSVFYVCGPPAMINVMLRLLQDDLSITKESIKIEEFVDY